MAGILMVQRAAVKRARNTRDGTAKTARNGVSFTRPICLPQEVLTRCYSAVVPAAISRPSWPLLCLLSGAVARPARTRRRPRRAGSRPIASSRSASTSTGTRRPNGIPRPGTFAQADPKTHYSGTKTSGVNTIQTFCVSRNGYAWYKESGVAPVAAGAEARFLKEIPNWATRTA